MALDKEKQLSFPFEVFEEEILNPVLGHKMTELEEFVAGLLLEASSEKPLQIKQIIEAVKTKFQRNINSRTVKDIIRGLRRNHAFPILSRREKPAGLWWCSSMSEMKEFMRLWQAQYSDEIYTLQIMVKNNFPRLAGQMKLTDISQKK